MALSADQVVPHVVGGLIICLAITLNLWFNNKFTSLSALFYEFVTSGTSDIGRKAALVAGIVFASAVVWNINGYGAIKDTNIVPFESEAAFISGLGIYGWIISGLLVGLGSKIAGGGVSRFAFCGVPSLSIKSIFAVATFLGVGFLTATAKNKSSILTTNSMSCALLDVDARLTTIIFSAFALGVVVLGILGSSSKLTEIIASFLVGNILSIGYMVSGMAQRSRMIDFLTFREGWNAFLLFVFLGCMAGNFLVFNIFLRKNLRHEDAGHHFIDVIVGSAIFGVGLGLSGLTPGTALVVAPVYFPEILVFFLVPVIFGTQLARHVEKWLDVLRVAGDRADAYSNF